MADGQGMLWGPKAQPWQKRCSGCGETKPLGDYHRSRNERSGRTSLCRVCVKAYRKEHYRARKASGAERAYNAQRFDKTRDMNLRRNFGISLERYEELKATQGGVCAICGEPPRGVIRKTGVPFSLAVDHCHSSGRIRGLLCNQCNQGLGCFRDRPDLLLAAIEYLRRHEAN